jgi:hypothetical protein
LTEEDAWIERAHELAAWVRRRLIGRASVYGAYRSQKQVAHFAREGKNIGSTTTVYKRLTDKRLVRHFAGQEILGTFPANKANQCLWAAWDFDNHDTNPTTAEANWQAVRCLYDRLVKMGFHPLLTDSNGNGGYHLRVLFTQRVPGDRLRQFVTALTPQGLKVDTFPKQADIRTTDKQVGNWLRLPGKHHKRDHWSTVWNGRRWLEGHDAIDFMLSLSGDAPRLLPKHVSTTDTLSAAAGSKATPTTDTRSRAFSNTDKDSTGIRSNLSDCFVSLPAKLDQNLLNLVRKHVPKKPGERRKLTFTLARHLLPYEKTAAFIKQIFEAWWNDPRRKCRADRDTAYEEFVDACHRAKLPPVDWSAAARETLPPEADFYTERQQRVVRVCAYLQRVHGAEPFYLSSETAAKAASVAKRTAYLALQAMVHHGLLDIIEEGLPRRKAQPNKATTYTYLPLWLAGESKLDP